MLGLLRSGSHGRDVSPLKTPVKEPIVTEVHARDGSGSPEQINSPSQGRLAVEPYQASVISPAPSIAGSVRVSKSNLVNRTMGSIKASFGRFTNSFVREQHNVVRQRCYRELGAAVGGRAFDTSHEGLLEWIRNERLTRLPHKGGSWDRVLIAAHHFADQVHQFSKNIESFTEESGAATNLVFGQCLLLLELGHENAQALEKAFSLFYQFGLELSPLLKRGDIFAASQSITENLAKAFADLLQIVTGISISFYQAVHGGRASTRIDIFSSFSSLIENFRSRVHLCSHEMWDISLAIDSSTTDGCDVEVLQKWLAPQDTVLAFLASDHVNLANQPAQFTCTWFQPHLNAFLKSNDNILLVEGKVGSGKTTLANWTIDRLQRPIGRRQVSPLSFFFNYSIMAQETPLAMLKTLLFQLLTQRIGDINLFNAVNEVYRESKNLITAQAQEEKLWVALEKVLLGLGDDEITTIIIDGMNDAEAQKDIVQNTCKKLSKLAQSIASVRLIQFSQPFDSAPTSSTRLQLSATNVYDDIRTVVRAKVSTHRHFEDREEVDQEMIIEQIADAAEGSMLWASLICKYLRLSDSCKDFDADLKAVLDTPKTISEAVKKLLTALKLDSDCKKVLSFLVAAERPLQVGEIEALLRADVDHLSMDDQSVDIPVVLGHISPFTVQGEGMVAMRHYAIKQALIAISSDSKLSLQLKERHKDLLTRLFIYAKATLHGEHEPTLTCLQLQQVESRLSAHRLLEYAVRYWTVHFKKSSLFKAQGELALPKEFKRIFPGSVTFSLLEQACWSAQSFAHEALALHKIAFRVRTAIFGREHACVLQSALFCALLCETVLSLHTEALEWYAMAATISKIVVGVQADITISICKTVLRISETFLSKKRTTIMTYREEILLILVSSYKHRFGQSSKEVLEIYQKLSELYILIEEETKATEILEIVQKLTVIIYGGHSDQAQSITRKAEVMLRKHEHVHEVDTFDGFLFGGYVEETEEAFTLVRVEIVLKLALEFIARGEFERAEELYIELWLRLTDHCHSVRICEWHEKKIEVMLIYARFLEKHKRSTEASALLLAIWAEYEHHEFSMFESIVILLKEVAVCMKVVGLLTIALTVFRKCWSFFKHQHKETHVIFKEIEEYISQTSTEVVKTTTTTVTTTSSETIIREVFESSISSSETTISTTTIELCRSLTKIYFKEERWSEAISCIKSLLLKSWASFFGENIETIVFSSHFSSESIELVIQLAHCYISQKRYEKAEEIYIRLYRCHRKHCRIDDVLVIKYSEMILAFYAKHELFTKAISFYQELLVEYRAFYGLSHAMTIKILYALGDICRRHYVNYGYWLEYYIEIVANLNKGALICHEEAFRALVIVAEHYYETLRFSEAIVYFKSIFATFCKFGTKYKYFEKHVEVQKLIEHYFRSLEETKIDIHVHVTILKELREACIKFYGAASLITIGTLIVLAEVSCRSEKYEFEAISYYEHIMKHSTTVSTEVVKRSQTTLRTLYVKQITSTTTTTVVTKETIERATHLIYERYIEIRKSHSCTHETTLTSLRELITLYFKQQKLELAIKELKSIIIECITKVKSAKELVETAKFVAALFISCGFVSHGFEIIRELKLQVIYKITQRCTHFEFDVTSMGRACFAFIAAFEYYIRADFSVTLAMYMSDLVAEALFYERFVHYVKVKAHVEKVLLTSARLRQILVRTKRVEDFAFVEGKVIEYFSHHEAWVGKITHKHATASFVRVLVEYFSVHSVFKSWTAAAGHAAVNRLKVLLQNGKHKEALELATCTFRFLMAHEGLDDPTEITLGFQLCLMMAGRTEHGHKCGDAVVQKAMMDLSRQILAEVFDICKQSKIDISQCQLPELNELIILIGEQKDYGRLQWLLQHLWSSREGQSKWTQETILYLGKRLVQVQFAAGNVKGAINLCEDIVYNVRRVHGPKHHHTLSFHALLATMYTSIALKFQAESTSDATKNKKRAQDMAALYFRKAVHVHDDVLKLIVNQDEADLSDADDDDLDSMTDYASRNGSTVFQPTSGFAATFKSRDQEVEYVRQHIRRLHLAVQRYGGWSKSAKDYEKLTHKVYSAYGKELKMNQDQVLSNKWKIEGYGHGKAEGGVDEDGFRLPISWKVVDN